MTVEGLPDYLPQTSFASILNEDEFNNLPELTVSVSTARGFIEKRYPKFDFKGLNEEGILRMAAHVVLINKLSNKVVDLVREDRLRDSFVLSRKIKLVGDPIISAIQSPIAQSMDIANNDINMALSLMGLREVENAKNWVEFIIRTWGEVQN